MHIHAIYSANQILIRVAASQEYVNTYLTRRASNAVRDREGGDLVLARLTLPPRLVPLLCMRGVNLINIHVYKYIHMYT